MKIYDTWESEIVWYKNIHKEWVHKSLAPQTRGH